MSSQFKLFNKYDTNITIRDPALVKYINLKPVIVPHNFGRHERKGFWKSEQMNIVERLITHMMVPGHRGKKHLFTSGHNTGKFATNVKTVMKAFQIISEKTSENPVEVLVRAVENSAPMEEITTVEYGGIRVPKAVDTSPQRRVDLALRWIVQGAYMKATNSRTSSAKALADELILAFKNDKTSYAVSKRLDSERQAAASR